MNRIPNKISYHLGIADSKRQTAQQHPPPLLGWRWSPRDAYAGGWPRRAAQNGSCKYALPAAVWPIVHPSLPTGNHQRCNRFQKVSCLHGCYHYRVQRPPERPFTKQTETTGSCLTIHTRGTKCLRRLSPLRRRGADFLRAKHASATSYRHDSSS